MRQYDTRNSRIVLICAKRSLCAAFSVLPYGEGLRISDLRVDSQKQRHPSGGVSVSSEMVFELEGVELGADGKVVSYAKFLYPTNALVAHKSDSHSLLPQPRPSIPRALPGSRHKPATTKATPAGTELGSDGGDTLEYNPNLLDDPQWPCGKHKRVLIFASYMTTVIEYVKPSDLKKDMNETFREKFPHIKLTLSKIRSLKREMRNLSEECSLEPVTVSMAYVYFEKLVLQGKLNKQNRKLCAGACVLLAAKISSDLRKNEVKQLIDKLEERFRFNRRDLIGFEFTVLVALELALYLPENQVLPHYRRLTQQF
ncbi:PREDICTED: CDK5 and ABL1 enzyme substrate 2 isoform X2 [Chinchilla lanigera]|nr:PREDICTED: CDK5 and ABL1 enzyme substrate 2 isoform X2 [Chinchilla lanigera]